MLAHYTPVDSYYKLVKKIDDDPEFDTKRAKNKLRLVSFLDRIFMKPLGYRGPFTDWRTPTAR